ncbi:ABC transporter ATP-binding protein [Methylocapsa sp. S129]|uniref:ABC transporter ATP-binding protein n=1 Tax=Methylocapsa sp. S129 TaxID=1641869 RepID=UPI00131DBE87|nr:ABC transporter ATP-binding protein [Methylocapsa sp. S129]
MSPPEKLLEARDLAKTFGKVAAVRGVSFALRRGETFGIVGESGSGKSTLARLLLRLIEPSGGGVHFRGRDLTSLGREEMRRERRHIQMIFQDPFGSLNPRMTVGELVAEPMHAHDIGERGDRGARALKLLDEVGLPAAAGARYPHEFSGGQRQRIAIARALASEPALIVADEPVSALDVSVQAQVLNLLLDLKERHGMTLLFISHDLRVVEFICDRIAVMYLGEIVELGDKAAICGEPRHPYTQALFASAPGRPKTARLAGEIPNAADVPSGCAFRTRCPRAFDRCAIDHPPLRALGGERFAACHLVEPAAEAVS